MRILSYNVWNGGGERLGLVEDVIRAARADVVALQEVTAASAGRLAAGLAMELVFGETDGLFDLHVAWLSGVPVERAANHRLPELAKTLLEIEVSPSGAGMRLFTTHLASRHEEELHPRAGEVAAILGVLADAADTPHVLVGDLNALAPGDAVGAPPAGVEPRGEARPGARREVIRLLESAEYVDCYRALQRAAGFTYPAEAPWLRLDYVFASPSAAERLRGCDVVAEARASDHLPLYADFAVS